MGYLSTSDAATNTTEQTESIFEASDNNPEKSFERPEGTLPDEGFERGSGEFKGDGSGRRAGEEKFAQ